jgi:glycosyltransferase involved in cell wall biosynthesis
VVVTLHDAPEEKVEEREGIKIYRLPLDNVYWPFGSGDKANAVSRLMWHVRDMWNSKAVARFARILSLEKPDLVHTHNFCGFSASVWSHVNRSGLPLVHTLHDYYLLCSRRSLYRNGSICSTLCSDCKVLSRDRRKSVNLPDAIISVSRYTLNRHAEFTNIDLSKTDVICNIQEQQDEVLPLATDPSQLTFGYIGKIEPEKGIETLLEATKTLNSGWQLKIAGKGAPAYVRSLREQYPSPQIEWLGFVQPSAFYSMVDTVILPSLWGEPLTYICLECLYAGKPMICSRAGGTPEMASLGCRVEMFDPGDARGLCTIMAGAINNMHLWKKVQIPGPESLAQFTEQSVYDRYMRVFQAAISSNQQVREPVMEGA